MRGCPFCDYDEGWVKETSFKKPIKYRVECAVCGATGPEANSHEMAIKKWDGLLAKIDDDKKFKAALREDAMGGVAAPMSTLNNTPGMGNAIPGSPSTGGMGSGDKWGNTIGGKPYTQGGKTKKKKPTKKKKIVKEGMNDELDENNVNPYDKIGQMMLKRAKVKTPFKKKKDSGNQNAMTQKKFEHEIMPLDDYLNEGTSFNEDYRKQVINFLDTPWQEDTEIELVSLINEYRDRILSEPKFIIQDYIKRLYDSAGYTLELSCSDEFILALQNLLI